MTIQPYIQPSPAAVVDHQAEAVHRLHEWAQSASAAHQIAETLVQTAFCPAAFKGKAGDATAAILSGLEVGLQPMAALRAFDIIQGQAAPRAITLRAVVQSQGHEIEVVESTASRCVMRGRRRGAAEWQKVSWTVDRARELGLLSKDSWKKQPIAMLLARATSELARLIAADAILGIGYSIEEIADGGPGELPAVESVEPTSTGTRRMSRKTLAPVPEPEPEEVPAEVVEPDPDLITPGQLKALHASLRDAGILDRDRGLEYLSQLVGREVTSSKDLTRAEAHAAIDALKADIEPTS